MKTFNVYLGRSNVQEVVLREPMSQGGDLITDLSSLTAVGVRIVGFDEITSTDYPGSIWWTDTETRTVSVNGAEEEFTGQVIKLQLGVPFADVGVPEGEYTGCLIGYDAIDNAEGVVYDNELSMVVLSGCE